MDEERIRIAENKYRPLKKELQRFFKRLRIQVEAEGWPEMKDLREFLDRAEMMVCYPGFGDEYYQEFSLRCRQLESAFAAGDSVGFQEAFSAVCELKKGCHHRFR